MLRKSIVNRDSIDPAGVITLSVISYFMSICRLSVITGRGLKSGDNFKLLYDLADKLNAAGTLFVLLIFTLDSFFTVSF